MLAHVEELEADIQALSDRIEEETVPFEPAVELLCTIPGVQRRAAEVIIAEIGTDMSVFPTAQHLASWAGLCPGQNESAGKRKSANTRKSSKWLRKTLTESARAAARTKETYLFTVDQRVFPDLPPVGGGFVLLDANGTPVAGGAGLSVGFVPAPAGPMQVTVRFNPSAIAVAKALEICGPATNLGLVGAFGAPPECTGPRRWRIVRVVWKHARVVRMSRRERALMARILRAERAYKHRHAHKHRRWSRRRWPVARR